MLRQSMRPPVSRIYGYVCPLCSAARGASPFACTARFYAHDAQATFANAATAQGSSINGNSVQVNGAADGQLNNATWSKLNDVARLAPTNGPPTSHATSAKSVVNSELQANVEKDSLPANALLGLRTGKNSEGNIAPSAEQKTPETPQEEAKTVKTIVRATRSTARKTPKQRRTKDSLPGKVTPLKRSTTELQTDTVDSMLLDVTALNTESTEVSKLSHGLDRVLFNPGVYHLQDPRSWVYNFDPYLSAIMPVSEFDFSALKNYITSSADEKLARMARENNRKYVGSSSSMTGVLSHFHYLLSNWRPPDTTMLSRGFAEQSYNYTRTTRAPAAVFLRYNDGVYAIDADKEFDTASILMNLGKSMEKLLTMPPDEFERYRKTSENKWMPEDAEDETYHYSTFGDFLMRSQLDAYDPRLPGTGMFDLKTRAVVSIRMDSDNPDGGAGYQINNRFGDYGSYEKEYYDMIRAAFVKYSLQVRIGRMDGIFVAYHNTRRIFGFQYVSLPEMDRAIHEQEDTTLGDAEFKLSLSLWNKVLDQATAEFPEQSLRFHFETREATDPFMYIFAEPVTEEEIKEIQSKNNAKIEETQRKLLFPESLEPDNSDVAAPQPETEQPDLPTQDSNAHLSQSFDSNDQHEGTSMSTSDNVPDSSEVAHHTPSPGEDLEETLTQSSESNDQHDGTSMSGSEGEHDSSVEAEQGPSPEEDLEGWLSQFSEPGDQSGETSTFGTDNEQGGSATAESKPAEDGEVEINSSRPLLAMALSVRNFVNGVEMPRPRRLNADDSWKVQYRLSSFNQTRGRELYAACQRRRMKTLGDEESGGEGFMENYRRRLRAMSKEGHKWRDEQDMKEREQGVITLKD